MDEAEEDDEPQLSTHALAALQEFHHEKDIRNKHFEDLKSQAEDQFAQNPLSMDAFSEDWNMSQFWYSDETATTLAKVLLEGATSRTSIAVVSAPSVYIQLKNLLKKANVETASRPRLTLLEFDERFAVFEDFVHYDYAQPLRIPNHLRSAFDRIIADPPFLSQDCQVKTALSVRALASSWQDPSWQDPSQHVTPSAAKPLKLIACTGERMTPLILELYGRVGVRETNFTVKHAKGLSNEFRCFANCGTGGGGGDQVAWNYV